MAKPGFRHTPLDTRICERKALLSSGRAKHEYQRFQRLLFLEEWPILAESSTKCLYACQKRDKFEGKVSEERRLAGLWEGFSWVEISAIADKFDPRPSTAFIWTYLVVVIAAKVNF